MRDVVFGEDIEIKYLDPTAEITVPQRRSDPAQVPWVDQLSLVFGEFGVTEVNFPAEDLVGLNHFQATAWNIVFSMRSMVASTWDRRWKSIITETVRIGTELLAKANATPDGPKKDMRDPELQAEWRIEVYNKFSVKIPAGIAPPVEPKRRGRPRLQPRTRSVIRTQNEPTPKDQ
jgi:hypothetical protein